MSIINYFFEKHIERCKKELENFENNKFKEVREDLRVETRKYIEEINNFLRSINSESFTDFNGFNSKIKTFNEELNRIMKASANISTLVYVIQNVSEDDFYTYTDFISSFSYDKNKFNNTSERDIKNLKRLDKFLERADDDFELYKERGDLRAEIGLYNEAIDDYKKALELNPNYDEAKNALEEINKKLTDIKIINVDKTNNDVKVNNTQNKESEKYYEEGVNYNKDDNYKKTIEDYDKRIEAAPQNIENYKDKVTFLMLLYNENENLISKYEKTKDHKNEINKLKAEEEEYCNLAMECYNKIIELSPKNSDAYRGKADIYKILADKNFYKEEEYHNLAIKYYDYAINLNPENSDAYKGKADIYKILAERNTWLPIDYYHLAMECYNKMIKLDPIEAYKGKAYMNGILSYKNYNYGTKIKGEKYGDSYLGSAIRDYYDLIELNPENIEIYKDVIIFLIQLSDKINNHHRIKCYERIIICCSDLIELNPKNIESYKDKITFLRKLSDKIDDNYYKKEYYKLVIKCYDKAIELKPNKKLYEDKAKILDLLKNIQDRYGFLDQCRIARNLFG